MTEDIYTPVPFQRRAVVYPTADGNPMAETDEHRDLMVYFIEALKAFFAALRNVYVSGNNFVFYEAGNPKKKVAPDVYLVFGVPMRQRRSYKAWEEGGRLPEVIIEFTSRKTRKTDTNVKRPLYETILRVPEYFLFDPTGDYLKPRFQGYRLVDGLYIALEMVDGRIHSERLELDLVMDGSRLRLFDPRRQEWLLTPEEATRLARQEAEARRAAEAEVERLQGELDILRAQPRR